MRVSLYLRGEADIERTVLRKWDTIVVVREQHQTVTYEMKVTRSEINALQHAYGLLRRSCALFDCEGEMYFQGALHVEYLKDQVLGLQPHWNIDVLNPWAWMRR